MGLKCCIRLDCSEHAFGRNLLAVHCLERVSVCPVTAPRLGKDPAPVCVVSSRWMSPAGVEVSAGEF